MGLTLAITAGGAVGLGIVLTIAGLLRAEPSTDSSTGLWTSVARWWETLSARRRGWLFGSVLAGVLIAVATGWLIALVIVPAGLILLPGLLSSPPQREIETLAGLDRWVRLIATSLTAGKSIRDAIFATRRQVAPVLREPVARLCTRLDQRWTMRDALWVLADELDSADADAVVAALAIASSRGGAGARVTLSALSDNIQDRLRALREIAAERAKPRAVVRQVTLITLAVLGGALLLNPQFFEPYSTPLGQAVAVALAAIYLSCLIMLRRRTVPQPTPRFLRSAQ